MQDEGLIDTQIAVDREIPPVEASAFVLASTSDGTHLGCSRWMGRGSCLMPDSQKKESYILHAPCA